MNVALGSVFVNVRVSVRVRVSVGLGGTVHEAESDGAQVGVGVSVQVRTGDGETVGAHEEVVAHSPSSNQIDRPLQRVTGVHVVPSKCITRPG